MADCTRCSNPIAAGDAFCPRCGTPSTAGSASVAQTLAASPASRPPSDPSSLGHGRFEPGARLGARYRIVGLLGRGGMGEVYRADDLELGQSVALKFLPDRLRRDADALARFRSEVRLARQIAHPNVARVYDIGEADGHVFLTMEYVDGEDLSSVLRRMGRPSHEKAVEIARQLCLGLAAAHERGVLHRDLKPANVMIDGRGRVRVMDFGLAALAESADTGAHIVGTPAYMAPEQLLTGQVTLQSDVYALGLVLYELFTGKRVHGTSDPGELRRQHQSGSVPTPSSIVSDMDPVVERVVLRCLENDPRLRPPTAYAVLGALPGGDPLAAALAAGETPSPELVAHAGESGGLAPAWAAALLVTGIAATLVATWLSAPAFRPFMGAPAMLAFKAAATLEALGYDHLPRHTASGFAVRSAWVDRLQARHGSVDSLAGSGPGAVFFWRRFAPDRLVPSNVHSSVTQLADPPPSGAGSVSVLLDPRGRLLGLMAIPARDSSGRATSAAPWALAFAQAGIDTSRLAAESRGASAPVASDTAASWSLVPDRPEWGPLHVRAAAYRGKLVWFAIEDSLGSATAQAVAKGGGTDYDLAGYIQVLIWLLLCAGGIVLGRRNLKLGRGDRRGAFRLAAFVFVATALESVFTWSFPENGVMGVVDQLTSDRGLGHALIHAGQMWLAYVAIEPYVRRLWPRMLVSWARLASGRARDPMVGRDLLAGLALGSVGAVVTLLLHLAVSAAHLQTPLLVLAGTDLAAIASPWGFGFQVVYSLSVMVLTVLLALVILLLVHLLTRRDLWTFLLGGLVVTVWSAGLAFTPGSIWAIAFSVVPTLVLMVALFRFGLLTALAAVFVQMVISVSPPVFGADAWFTARGLVAFALLAGLMAYGGWAALAGRPIMGDVLDDRRVAKP